MTDTVSSDGPISFLDEMEIVQEAIDLAEPDHGAARLDEKVKLFRGHVKEGEYLDAYDIFRGYPEVALLDDFYDSHRTYLGIASEDRAKAEIFRSYILKKVGSWDNDLRIDRLTRGVLEK